MSGSKSKAAGLRRWSMEPVHSKLVEAAGVEPDGGIENKQVIDSKNGQKGQNSHNAEFIVQKLYKRALGRGIIDDAFSMAGVPCRAYRRLHEWHPQSGH
jgi:hypothetical protein